MSRVDPFADLDEFTPKTTSRPPVERDQIERLAQDHGFPSRGAHPAPTAPTIQRSRRRPRVTGRNQQFNIKATEDTIARFYRLYEAMGEPLGEVLDRAVTALEKELARAGRDDQ